MADDPRQQRFHGLEIAIRSLPGACAVRVVHPGGQAIAEHRHDWPTLGLHVLGGYRERYDGGEAWITGPSAVLHPSGAPHADRIDEAGLETISIRFDPAWLRPMGVDFRLDRTRCWTGGRVAAAARGLAAAWSRRDLPAAALTRRTAVFIGLALAEGESEPPAWLGLAVGAINRETPLSTADLARRLGLHPAWLARAYRAATGEGLHETRRRKRVERAAALLRGTDLASVEIALRAGFCDQSHMNRSFRALAGRTPLAIRAERARLAAFNPCA